MKRAAAVLFFSLSFLCGHSQKIQTIVPKQVVAGNAFQIQYIINKPSELLNVTTPSFDNLQLISGPNYYKGNSLVNGKTQPIENIAYTLVAKKEGVIKIGSLTANFKNESEEKSDEIMINVTPKPKPSFNASSAYTDINLYASSSKTDLDKLVKANLFIKADVSKKICFLGEAITATFKLYSRLQSTSEVINAPSLYGFSVMDMLDINEAHQAVETINGKIFNTSVLRKLQLYPAQTGKLTVDAMQLQNTIEFIDSASGKKIEVEKNLASNPINIVVRPLPSEQPANYSGAVGQFNMDARFQPSSVEANTQGRLIVKINGKGNFIQFSPPNITFPKEFDVADPIITDEVNKNSVPTEGSRSYTFNFTTDRAGSYTMPPVSFSFFDVTTGRYIEVSTDSLKLKVLTSIDSNDHKNESDRVQTTAKNRAYLFLAAILSIVTIIFFFQKRKLKKVQPLSSTKTDYLQKFQSINTQQISDKQLCFDIQKLLVEVNKDYNLSPDQKMELKSIQNNCQLMIYSDVSAGDNKIELLKKVEIFLKQMQA